MALSGWRAGTDGDLQWSAIPSPSLRAKRIKKKGKRRQASQSSDQNVQVSDTTGDDSSNTARLIKNKGSFI